MEVRAGYKQTEVGVIPEDWQTAIVADLVESTAPICYGVVQVGQFVESGVPIVAIKFVKEIAHAPLHRTAINLEKPYVRSRPRGGDVLISIKGTIGRVGIVPNGFQGNISRELARLRIREDSCPEYVAHQLESGATQERIMQSVVGTTRLEFSIATLRKFPLPIPPTKTEQRAIAAALSDVDALLEGQTRLIAKKRDLKQAAMQQLLTGQTRLPGFSGEWEVKRLGSVLRFQVGFPFSSAFFNDDEQGLRLVKNRDLKSDDQVFHYSGTYDEGFLVRNGDVLIGMDGDFLPCRWAKGMALLNQRVGRVVPRLGLDRIFAYYYLIEPLKDIEAATSSTTVKHLSHGDVEDIERPIPEIDEQTAIAAVLSDMDAELSALEARRDKTRALKQAMMQELLTGRTRLI